MKLRTSLLAAATVLTLAACNQATEAPTETPAAAPAATAEAPAASAVDTAAAAPTDSSAAAPAAAGECAFNLEGNDAMQFNVKNIDVPKTCTEFTINLKHTGSASVEAMGHNVVIAKSADIMAIATDGASVKPNHIKEGDTRVIANSEMIGGGGSTSVKFDVSKIADGGYSFFCSFPGHAAMMQGTLTLK